MCIDHAGFGWKGHDNFTHVNFDLCGQYCIILLSGIVVPFTALYYYASGGAYTIISYIHQSVILCVFAGP